MFYPKLIYDILKNKVYLGTLVWNRKHYSKKLKTKSGKGYRYLPNDPSEIIEVSNAHDPVIDKRDFDLTQDKLARNKTTNVIRFKDNVYYLSGVVYCKPCGLPFRGNMLSRNSTSGEKRAWYRCSSTSHVIRHCRNKAVTSNALEIQVWAILEVIAKSMHVVKNLKDAILIAAAEPEEHYFHLVAQIERAVEKNLRTQKLLFDAHADDNISPEIFKEKAEELRVEEKKFKKDIQCAQARLLTNDQGVDNRLRAQNFLCRIQDLTSAKEFTDQDVKEFVRIIFRRIDVENQRIVSFELNQPWKYCYETGLRECQNPLPYKELEKKEGQRSYVVFCSHSVVR